MIFVSSANRVNVQGGTFVKESIEDTHFPIVRIIKIGAEEPKVIEIKDKGYLSYYRDMFNNLRNTNAPLAELVCQEAHWCSN